MNTYFSIFAKIYLLFIFLIISHSCSQNKLKLEYKQIAGSATGILGISALHIESNESISFNGEKKFPMQSVYKFPIAMVMLSQIDAGKFSLNDSVKVSKDEFIPKQGHSPLRNKYPNGTKLTIKDLLEYSVSKSDGTASDVLLRLLGGANKVQQSIQEMGVKNIAISTTEMHQIKYDTVQYENWTTPKAMNELLKIFHTGNILSQNSKDLLSEYMSISNKWFDSRIKGLLPPNTKVIHKTGTSRTNEGLTRATNDVGIISLPDGSNLAISVFLKDSYDTQEKREMIIAQAALAAYDYWVKSELKD